MKLPTGWIIGIVGALIGAGLLVWFLSSRPAPAQIPTQISSTLDSGTTKSVGVSSGVAPSENTVQTIPSNTSSQTVFKIADGPVAGATFVQTFNPTTTLARFVLQENGHVQDQPIDVPGSLPRAVSNTTIPGIESVTWGGTGGVGYFQYIDSGVIKTLSIIFPSPNVKVTVPPQIQFFPDGITALAPSPDGTELAYLLKTSSGSDGYLAHSDASTAKKLFSIPLSELTLSWPSAGKLLLGTKSASGAPGMIFSADTKTGGIVPLLYAPSITAIADASFSHIIYQSLNATAGARYTYSHDITHNTDTPLAFDPIPEKCTASTLTPSMFFCAVPNQYVDGQYLDLWHQGAASVPDAILAFDLSNNKGSLIATPGSSDGGEESDILTMAVSPDNKYLLFIKKGDRSLWGVRLTQ